MYLVGLTGGISTGKSTVSNMFRQLDVPIIDADLIARAVVEPGRRAWHKIRKEFGPEVFESDGQLNRKKLGAVIFSDEEKRKKLNAITHPEIAKEIAWDILKYFFKGHQFVIIDSPLLYEANTWLRFVSKVIVVSCEEELQLERLLNRDDLTEPEAKSRISAQMSLTEKRKRADFVIENSNRLEMTREQVKSIYKELRECRQHWKIRIPLIILLTFSTASLIFYCL